jgi:4-diphosphocytidyl-2-C-methyl-D-erythritol kinase
MLVRERAHAKINLALHITGRRQDGYHELDSIVAFAELADVLTIAPAEAVSLNLAGPFAGDLLGDGENSVTSAWNLLSEFSRQQGAPIIPVNFQLEKNLPVASGIGGGSADAAAALRGLIRYFGLKIMPDDLSELALRLGADVPVCLLQNSSRMRGIGEIIEPVSLELPSAMVLVNPLIPAPTSKVFSTLNLQLGQSFGAGIVNLHDIESWRNDLTAPAVALVPEIAEVIGSLNFQPEIICSRMSGSGATCFGLFESLSAAQTAAESITQKHPAWWVVATTLRQ